MAAGLQLKSKLSQIQIDTYLSELKRHIQDRLPSKQIVTDADVYENYPLAVSKKMWSEIAHRTHLERTKIYKHYTFTFTRKFHPDITGEIQNQINSQLAHYIDKTQEKDSRRLLNHVWDYQLRMHFNLHHDAVDQYIRYYLRKNYGSQEPQPLAADSPQKHSGLMQEKDSPQKPIEQLQENLIITQTQQEDGTPLSILANILKRM